MAIDTLGHVDMLAGRHWVGSTLLCQKQPIHGASVLLSCRAPDDTTLLCARCTAHFLAVLRL